MQGDKGQSLVFAGNDQLYATCSASELWPTISWHITGPHARSSPGRLVIAHPSGEEIAHVLNWICKLN